MGMNLLIIHNSKNKDRCMQIVMVVYEPNKRNFMDALTIMAIYDPYKGELHLDFSQEV